jgi:hypothetical protein
MIKMRRAIVAAAAVVAGLGGLAVVPATAALAGVSGTPDFTDAANPVSGYYAFNTSGETFTHVNGYVGLQNNANELQAYTGTLPPVSGESAPADAPVNGAGPQLCNDNTGFAFQAGAVYLGGDQFAVLWGYGTFDATGVRNNGDPCEDGILASPGVASGAEFGEVAVPASGLDTVPFGDTIEVNLLYNNNGHRLAGCTTDAEVVASNITTGNHQFSACVSIPSHAGFNEAALGVEGDTTGLSAPAATQLLGFAHFTLTDIAGHHGFVDNSSHWTGVAVDTVGTATGGNTAQAVLLAGGVHVGNWRQYEGTPTG